MGEEFGTLSMGAKWLLEKWMEKFSGVVESMMEERPALSFESEGGDDLGESALILEQRFGGAPEPMLWMGIPEAVYQDLGGRILAAAGLESSDAEENRATCLEAVEQSLAGLTTAIGQRAEREIVREQTRPCPIFPSGLPVMRVVAAFGEKQLVPLWIAFAPALISWLDTKPAEPTSQSAQQLAQQEEDPAQNVPNTSRTFELLLDVSLPVSISFGKAELPVKDILKLTNGSIVELNRSINEPVDIVVNGCTIARGEVVVVEGNYGVRINSIVSRKERLRTGGAAVAESRARVGAQL